MWIRAQTSEFFPGRVPAYAGDNAWPMHGPLCSPRPSQLSLSLHLCLSCDLLGGGQVCALRATAVRVLVTVWCGWLKSTPGPGPGEVTVPLVSACQLSSPRTHTNEFQPTLIPQVNVYQPCGSVGDSKSLGMLQIGPLQRCVITGREETSTLCAGFPSRPSLCVCFLWDLTRVRFWLLHQKSLEVEDRHISTFLCDP